MICRLCLKDEDNVIEIFGEDGSQLNIVQLVEKYFGLELKPEDKTSKFICQGCWAMVTQFHDFCLVIEEAQRRLDEMTLKDVFSPEIVIIKSEPFGNEGELKEEDSTEDIFQEDSHTIECADDEMPANAENLNEEPRRSTRIRINKKDTRSISLQRKQKITTKKFKSEKKRFELKTKKNCDGDEDEEHTVVEERLPKVDESDAKIAAHMELICEICEEKVPTFSNLRTHMKQTHQIKGYAKCCNKKFLKRILLLEHVELHTNPDYFKCKLCGKTLADRQCYRQHMLLKHAAEEEKTYACDKCPKRFAKSYLLVNHRILHGERKHICEVCQSGFPSISLLNTHRKVKHLNYGIMCDICAKVLIGRAAFDLHQKEHQGVPIPKVQCTICNSWHKNKHCLQKHMRRHNEDGTKYTCKICGKQAPNRNALMGHQRYVHEAKRTHECNICNKSFKKPLALKEHMSLHTGEVLYNCPHCSRTFISSANMYSHRKKAHPLEFEETRRQRLEEAANPTIGTNKLKSLLETTKAKKVHSPKVVKTLPNDIKKDDVNVDANVLVFNIL